MNRNGKTSIGVIIGIAIAAVLIWPMLKGGTVVPPATPPGVTPPVTPPTTLTVCDTGTTPDVTVPTVFFDTGVSVANSEHSYRKVGATGWTAFTAGTAITNLEPNTEYEFLLGINTTSDWTYNDYGNYFKKTIPCLGAVSLDTQKVYNDNRAYPNLTFLNTLNNADNESLSAGETAIVTLRFSAEADTWWGNPTIPNNPLVSDNYGGLWRKKYPNQLCCRVDTDNYDKLELSYNNDKLNALPAAGKFVNQSSNDTVYCFEAPIFGDQDTDLKLTLDADDLNDPPYETTAVNGGSGSAATFDRQFSINDTTNVCTLFAGDYFVQYGTQALEWGLGDVNGNATGTANPAVYWLSIS